MHYTISPFALDGATDGEDFIAESGSVTFAPGQTQATIPLTIIGDTEYEGQEILRIALTGADGAQVVLDQAENFRSSWALIYINNDDPAPLTGADGAQVVLDQAENFRSSWALIYINNDDPAQSSARTRPVEDLM
ncbi:hypothetical protein H7J56_27520 [Mycolicibacterium murale]|uniref:Calx-beta domain-containing protein n=1 Tax=Mycolicibacterium murale TaxID=182220 RepID=UPI0021F30B31|nr:Calx-beta domain-containing protein [Mycolicibacterium murale]MCV7185698.1 hypothetical protein [Mycolicibacterium murale]